MSTQSPTRPAFGPRDVVRCTTSAGLPAKCPLKHGHIYTVRGIESVDALDAIRAETAPIVHLEGVPGAYGVFRFTLVAKANPAAPPVDPIAVRMAQVMREREEAAGACMVDDLARAGFTAAQIIEYADEARGLAGAPSGLMAA